MSGKSAKKARKEKAKKAKVPRWEPCSKCGVEVLRKKLGLHPSSGRPMCMDCCLLICYSCGSTIAKGDRLFCHACRENMPHLNEKNGEVYSLGRTDASALVPGNKLSTGEGYTPLLVHGSQSTLKYFDFIEEDGADQGLPFLQWKSLQARPVTEWSQEEATELHEAYGEANRVVSAARLAVIDVEESRRSMAMALSATTRTAERIANTADDCETAYEQLRVAYGEAYEITMQVTERQAVFARALEVALEHLLEVWPSKAEEIHASLPRESKDFCIAQLKPRASGPHLAKQRAKA